MSTRYKSIPITAARDIAKAYDKSQVIVVGWDPLHGKEHVTTYGVNKEQCRQAALGGERVKKALGWPVEKPELGNGVGIIEVDCGYVEVDDRGVDPNFFILAHGRDKVTNYAKLSRENVLLLKKWIDAYLARTS